MRLARDMKADINDVMISGLVCRGDSLNAKAQHVNKILKAECERLSMHFIEHSNILPNKHINGSGLHLNRIGNTILQNNFLSCIRI